MNFPIKSKLVIAISCLMIVIFSLAAYLFISEKKLQLSEDIFTNTLSYAKLSSKPITENYETFFAQESLVYFNREIQKILQENASIQNIQIISYSGKLIFDAKLDQLNANASKEQNRKIPEKLLNQIKTEKITIETKAGAVAYLQQNQNGEIEYFDQEDLQIATLPKSQLLNHIIIPANEKLSILYVIDYGLLEKQIRQIVTRIIYLALFAILLGTGLAIILSGKLTKPIITLVKGAESIAAGDLKTRVQINTHDELNYLGETFNKMAQDLEVSLAAKIFQEKLSLELKLAEKIQQQIIPKSVPKFPGIDLAADINPADEIGGDMYDFLNLGNNELLFYLGDVTGHGVPAGIVSSIANALFFGYQEEKDLAKIINRVNKVLKAKTTATMFMTLCLMHWNANNQNFQYVSAGHEQIIHFKARENSCVLEPAGGIALGMLDNIEHLIKTINVDLQPGDWLVIYSDGIPEAWKDPDEIYGMERLIASITSHSQLKTAEEMKTQILSDVNAFRNGYKQQDDITIIVVKKVDPSN